MTDPHAGAHPHGPNTHTPQPVQPPRAVQQTTTPRPQGAPTLHPPGAGGTGGVRPAGMPGIGAQQARPLGGQGHMPAAQPQGLPRQQSGSMINPAAGGAPKAYDDEPVALVDDGEDDAALRAPTTPTKSKITFGADLGMKKHEWKRQPKMTGNGAVRVKTFHAKLSDQGLEYLDEAINVFLDDHPDVDLKFVTTNVGMFDGKFKDLALVVNLWY